MRTVSFRSVLWGVALRLGLDPKVNLQANQAAALAEYINAHVRLGWEYYSWPELVRVERRVFRDAWDAGTAYSPGAEVWDETTAAYYVAVAPGTGNPVTDADYWQVQLNLRRYVALEQAGMTPMGEVLEVYSNDPSLSYAALRVPYTLGYEGVELRPDAPNVVWVRYRLRPSLFTAETWAADEAYTTGDCVYLPAQRECYLAIAAGTGKDPATEPGYWRIQELPYVLAEYVKRAAYAEALREDGQSDKAEIESNRARNRLDDEVDKVVGQQGVSNRFDVALPMRR